MINEKQKRMIDTLREQLAKAEAERDEALAEVAALERQLAAAKKPKPKAKAMVRAKKAADPDNG